MISAPLNLRHVAPTQLKRRLRERFVAASVIQIHGPRMVHLSSDEAVVTCVLKNGDYYLASFIEHYVQMGFRHIFFLDNGSRDQTLSIARSYENVSICRSRLPIGSNQLFFKRYLAEKSVRGGWCLDADIDEFFDYPWSGVVTLRSLLSYLNVHGYTAMLTQLLDMFSDKPLSHLLRAQTERLKDVYEYFDLSEITRTEYCASPIVANCGSDNTIADGRTALYWGGIRKMLYGNDCLLTKHSLFRPGAGIELFPHVHFVNRARLADVSGVMRHYKLTSNALAIAQQNRDNFTENSPAYTAFIGSLTSEPDRVIKSATARKFVDATDLTRCDFLLRSAAYEAYAMKIQRLSIN